MILYSCALNDTLIFQGGLDITANEDMVRSMLYCTLQLIKLVLSLGLCQAILSTISETTQFQGRRSTSQVLSDLPTNSP